MYNHANAETLLPNLWQMSSVGKEWGVETCSIYSFVNSPPRELYAHARHGVLVFATLECHTTTSDLDYVYLRELSPMVIPEQRAEFPLPCRMDSCRTIPGGAIRRIRAV